MSTQHFNLKNQQTTSTGNEAIPLDDAGNPKLRDIGQFLKKAIKEVIPDADVKYIDPSNLVQVSNIMFMFGWNTKRRK